MVAGMALVWTAAAAQSGDVKERIRNLRQTAEQGTPQVIPQLAAALGDEAVEVRLEAVSAISIIGSQHSLDPLIRATRDNDPEVQVRAVEGLVNFYLPGYQKSTTGRLGTALKSKFTDTNTDIIPAYVNVREDVVKAIGALARGGASMESRATAARAAGVLRGRAAIPDLLEALRSKDDAVMYETMVAFRKIGDPAVAPKISVYLRDYNDRVQIATIETTGLLRNKAALPDLYRVYENARNDKIRRAALTSVAILADEQSRPMFLSALAGRDEHLRAAAAEGIGRLRRPSDLPMLEKAFAAERRTPARLGMAFAIVNLGRTELSEFSALQYLVNTLNSRAYRGVADAYLIELAREPMVREQLASAIKQGTRDEKTGIARVLAASGDQRSLEHLEALSRDADEEVAREALEALRTLRSRM